jgi:hypothetical protein
MVVAIVDSGKLFCNCNRHSVLVQFETPPKAGVDISDSPYEEKRQEERKSSSDTTGFMPCGL